MTPLDDELRATLHARAGSLPPAPDPLGGIEARARGLRRRRTALAAAGTALAVAAVALTIPSLVDRDRTGGGTQFATSAPTVTSSTAALDPARPWASRGTPLKGSTSFQSTWSARHPGSTLHVLFGQLNEISAQEEALFVASGPDGDRYAFLTSSSTGVEVLIDEPLVPDTTALALELPGDEVPRLLVVAAPDSRALQYAADGTTFTAMVSPFAGQAGLGITPVEGDTAQARVRVIGADGTTVYDRPALAVGTPPANVLSDWPERGSAADGPDTATVRRAFAGSRGKAVDQARYRALYTGQADSPYGLLRYTVGQAWIEGDIAASTFGYTQVGTSGSQVFLGQVTPATPALVALLIGNAGPSDLLVVVPRPGTGQVSYDTDGSGTFTPVTGQDQRDGVVIIDRDTRASSSTSPDRLELLDGNGNPDQPIYRGPVAPFLCAAKECG